MHRCKFGCQSVWSCDGTINLSWLYLVACPISAGIDLIPSLTLRGRTCLDKSLLYVYNAICHHGIFPLSSKCSHFFQLMESQNPAWDNPADIVNVIFLFCTQEKQLLEWFCYDRLWIYSSDCIQEGRRCLLFLNGLAHWSGLPSGIKLNSWMTQ